MNRRFKHLLLVVVSSFSAPSVGFPVIEAATRPNVLLIITDDQGYGDLGVHGNPKIHTPHLDRLARASVRFQSFYVSPVCSPTRASLMTGRYNYRTGVVDTYLGRSLMHPDEVTLAEMLSSAGYATGIFGKWHLGDNYPMRAMDQGFQESLVLNGGGIGQPSDPPGGESYFNPMLRHNGQWVKKKGYVSDLLTDAAIEFISKSHSRPFFGYLAFNCPHTPLEVPEKLYAKYKQMSLNPESFSGQGHPIPKNFDPDTTAKIYGMVENIDENVGRLLAKLDELKLAKDTVVIFMTDNGPQQPRYNAGMFQRKGSTHEGGIRVPFFVCWLGHFESGRTVDRVTAHIDVAPTLLDICRAAKPANVRFDGVSLLPLLQNDKASWPDRILFFQWHRGDIPELYRAFAARSERYKLVQPVGSSEEQLPLNPVFRLYDLARDPLETKDIASEYSEIVEQMKKSYEAWFKDVTRVRDFEHPAPIFIGAPQENPVRLTRQDWRGPEARWTSPGSGAWEVDVRRRGRYEITARFEKVYKESEVELFWGRRESGLHVKESKRIPAGTTTVVFDTIRPIRGIGALECFIEQEAKKVGVLDLMVKRLE